MAMTRTLYTINGIATELGRDRRTVAGALADVPPDGMAPGGHKGWFLTTCLEALARRDVDNTPLRCLFDGDVLALEKPGHRESMTGRDEGEIWDGSIEEMAEIFDVEPETILHWLKAGAPFLVEGDWNTGKGFVLRFGWLSDWEGCRVAVLTATGQHEIRRRLRL